MNTDDIINTYQAKLGQQPTLEVVEGDREKTLQKVFNAQVLAKLKDRIVATYQILADISRGKRKLPAPEMALLAGCLA